MTKPGRNAAADRLNLAGSKLAYFINHPLPLLLIVDQFKEARQGSSRSSDNVLLLSYVHSQHGKRVVDTSHGVVRFERPCQDIQKRVYRLMSLFFTELLCLKP